MLTYDNKEEIIGLARNQYWIGLWLDVLGQNDIRTRTEMYMRLGFVWHMHLLFKPMLPPAFVCTTMLRFWVIRSYIAF